MTKPLDLPYRTCVGVMLLNAQGHVWLGHRMDDGDSNAEGQGTWWQMPQGGIDKGEEPRDAAARELYEETSIRSATIIAESAKWYDYDLPAHLIGKSWGGLYRGQTQKWIAMRFNGKNSEIDVTVPGHTQEFDAWCWAPMSELLTLVIPFKRGVYEKVVAEFRGLAC